jgi:hypothetical protein
LQALVPNDVTPMTAYTADNATTVKVPTVNMQNANMPTAKVPNADVLTRQIVDIIKCRPSVLPIVPD